MAVVTTNPRRRLSQIPAARTYTDVASRYSQAFQQALEQKEANEVSSKLNLFRLGEISWEDFKSFLTQKIKDAPAGSTKYAEYTGLMIDAEKYNTQIKETAAQNTVEKLRTQMLEAIPGQVTAKDELRIVREIKGQVDKDTSVYADLVAEEAKLKNEIANAGSSAGKKSIQDNLDKYYAQISVENENLANDYKTGKISGYELDQQLYQNGLNFQDALNQAERAGANIPTTYYQEAEDTKYIEDRLAQREVGQVFDVMNKSGEIEPVTHQELEADKLKTSPDFIRGNYSIEQPNINAEIYYLVGPDGKRASNIPFTSSSEAVAARKKLEEKEGYAVVVPKTNENGITTLEQYNFDPQTQTYSTATEPDTKLYSPVATGFENRFLYQPNTKLTDFLNAGIAKLRSFFSPEKGTVDYQKLTSELNPSQEGMGPFMVPTILSPPKAEVAQPAPEVPVVESTVERQGLFSKAKTAVQDFFASAKPTPTVGPIPGNMNTPSGNLDISGLNFNNQPFRLNLPKINIPDVNTPDFNLNLSGFSLPGQNAASTTTGPTMGPTSSGPGFLDRIKTFGQSALGSVKKFFGF